MNRLQLPRLINVLLVLLVVNAIGASWTAVFLLQRAANERAEQALRAEARTEVVREDVADLLDEVRDPPAGSPRGDLFDRAVRIERLLERHVEATDEENRP